MYGERDRARPGLGIVLSRGYLVLFGLYLRKPSIHTVSCLSQAILQGTDVFRRDLFFFLAWLLSFTLKNNEIPPELSIKNSLATGFHANQIPSNLHLSGFLDPCPLSGLF